MEVIKKQLDTLFITNDPIFSDKVKFTGRLTVTLIEETKTHVLVKIDGLEVLGEAFWIDKAEFENFAGAKISKKDPQKVIKFIFYWFIQIVRKLTPNDA